MKKTICLILSGLLILPLLAGCMKKAEQGNAPGAEALPTAETAAEWPQDLTSLPEFSDCEKIEYAGATANGYEIGVLCTLEQLENWRSAVNESGSVFGEFSVFHNGEYVVQLHESYAESSDVDRLRVTLYLTKVKEMVWPEEMSVFPEYTGDGRATAPLSVDTVYIEGWSLMEITLYGESEEGLQRYLDALEADGFKWEENEDGGFYRRFRDDLADQFAYEWGGDATVTLTWAILPAEDAAAE